MSLPEVVKTRTKDKYRVVYTDHQRLELEKEFHYSRYITIRRKAELAATLGLSERQVRLTDALLCGMSEYPPGFSLSNSFGFWPWK
ncbi:UNVERIFIED_CONTAM: Homeobox protein CDX-2 [Gekko kuhli]